MTTYAQFSRNACYDRLTTQVDEEENFQHFRIGKMGFDKNEQYK